MWSVRRHVSMPSTALLMWSGWLLRPSPCAPVSGSMFQPNFVAILTSSRIDSNASPTMRSDSNGP